MKNKTLYFIGENKHFYKFKIIRGKWRYQVSDSLGDLIKSKENYINSKRSPFDEHNYLRNITAPVLMELYT